MKMQHYSWKQIIVLGLDVLVSYFGIYSLPAYMPQLIRHLGVGEESIGYKVGAVNNVMLCFAMVGTVAAGILPSIVSHKRLLVMTLALQGVACITYGFSNSLMYLFISVATLGVFGGAATVCVKTMISTKCTESTQSYILTWTMGGPITISTALAPSLAGYLSFPAEKYPHIFPATSIFKMYPILLFQVIVGGSLILISLANECILNEENLSRYYDEKDLYQDTLYTSLVNDKVESETEEETFNWSSEEDGSSIKDSKFKLFLNNVLLNPCCLGALTIKAFYTSCEFAYITLVPVWLESPRSSFGRNYKSNDVSNILIISGVMTAVVNYTVLGKINSMMNPKVGLSIWITLVVVAVAITPSLSIVKGDTVFYIAYLFVNIMFNVFASGGYTPMQIMLQNSVPTEALAMMWSFCTLITRPMEGFLSNAFTSLFTWSIDNGHRFPLDYHFSFYCLSIMFLITYIPSILIRSTIQSRL